MRDTAWHLGHPAASQTAMKHAVNNFFSIGSVTVPCGTYHRWKINDDLTDAAEYIFMTRERTLNQI